MVLNDPAPNRPIDANSSARLLELAQRGDRVALNELIERSPDPAAIRECIKARIEPVASFFEADGDPDRAFVAMQMRVQLDELME